ncbi:unnamed protein product [Paramecium sonneborni]|uniref:Uncharacterized protein n=1 Tax=Paramecium sonneborni TaxID=65129 RepID=A0A8S1Q6F4_9CILI|nr:unnamed protein product [Paramecium sonneborni]
MQFSNEILINKSFSWFGQYDKKKRKNGRWAAFLLNQKILMNSGGYYRKGQKQGLWIDPIQNYSNSAQVFETGGYENDFRIGKWNFIFKDARIGGGFYQDVIQKQSKQIEFFEGFIEENQKVTFDGQNNINVMKVGMWDSMFCKTDEEEYKQIFEQYDKEENQKKIGKWVELDQGFNDYKQVTYNGEYNKKGLKIGKWDSLYCINGQKEYKYMQILFKYKKYSGGGSYDKEGNQKKIGKWVEVDERFNDYKQVTYNGEYNMQGIKFGRWDSLYFINEQKEYQQMKYIFSGGGQYDQDGNQKKIGKWVDLDEGFVEWKQVTYIGVYNFNGMKIGQWDSMYFMNTKQEYKLMYIYRSIRKYNYSGGGEYDQDGNQKKIGKWVELDEGFIEWKQVTYIGEYNLQGMKIGNWNQIRIN